MNGDTNTKKTEQIERELRDLIVKYKLQDKISLNKIKEWVYEATDKDPSQAFKVFMAKFEKLFISVKNSDEFKNIASTFIDAWNHFPHKDLGDLSPRQKIEMQNNYPSDLSSDFTEIVIPFEMTAILTLKAKMLGISLREYMLFILSKHIEDSFKDGKGLMELLFSRGDLDGNDIRYLPMPRINRKAKKITKTAKPIKSKKKGIR
ncbi:MAG: hypothetical protein WCO33_02040 [bacterium]